MGEYEEVQVTSVSSVLTVPWSLLTILCFGVVLKLYVLVYLVIYFILGIFGVYCRLFYFVFLWCKALALLHSPSPISDWDTLRQAGYQTHSKGLCSHSLSEPAMKDRQVSSVKSSGHGMSAVQFPCNDNFIN